jgi:hypothetical protein
MRQFPALTLVFCLLSVSIHADVVLLKSGHEIVGTVVSEDFQVVTLRTAQGDMPISRRDIAEVRRAPGGDVSPMEVLPVDPSAHLPQPGEILTMGENENFGALPADSTEVAAAPPEEEEEPVEATGDHSAPSDIPPGYGGIFFMVDGESWLKHGEQWRAVELNDLIAVGDEIRTEEGRSKVMLRGRGEVRLPPRSHLEVAAIDDDGMNVTLNLVRGRVWVDVDVPSSGGLNFNVQTPDLTAGVRGTQFHVAIVASEEERLGSVVAVLRGRVAADAEAGSANTRFVAAGYQIFCDTEGNFSAPQRIHIDLEEEFRQWDEWALQTHQDLAMVTYGPGGAAISGLIQLNAADQQRHAAIVAEAAHFTNINNQSDHLRRLAAAFLEFTADVGDLPPSEEEQGADGWQFLQVNPDLEGWSGPYIPLDQPVPILDMWENPIHWRRQVSAMSGNHYGELISGGPNGHFDEGRNDDLRELIVLPQELQERVRSAFSP